MANLGGKRCKSSHTLSIDAKTWRDGLKISGSGRSSFHLPLKCHINKLLPSSRLSSMKPC